VQYTVCNFIYAHKQSTTFPAPIFMKFANAKQHNSIRIGISMECTDIKLSVPLKYGCHFDNILGNQVPVINVCGQTKNVEKRGKIGQEMWDI